MIFPVQSLGIEKTGNGEEEGDGYLVNGVRVAVLMQR